MIDAVSYSLAEADLSLVIFLECDFFQICMNDSENPSGNPSLYW